MRIPPGIIGVAAGVVAGGAAGVMAERANYAKHQERLTEFSAWNKQFESEMGPIRHSDKLHNRETGHKLEDYLEDNPIAGNGRAGRSDSSWYVKGPDRMDFGATMMMGSTFGAIFAGFPAAFMHDSGRLAGLGGAAAIAAPVAMASMGVGALASNLLRRD